MVYYGTMLEWLMTSRIGYLTKEELNWLGINSNKDASPKDLNKLGVLRRDLPVKCPGGNNVPVSKFYTGEEESPFVLQVKLPNHFRSTSMFDSDAKNEATLFVNHSCENNCKLGLRCSLQKNSR